MKIVVCLKHATDPETAEFDLRTGALSQPNFLLGPLDFIALEQALRFAEVDGATVTAVTVGPARADFVLRKALTYGADAAQRVWADRLEEADSLTVARALAAAVVRLRPDIILLGTRSVDSASGRVAPALAEFLGLPLVTNVVAVTRDGDTVLVTRAGDAGWRDEFRVPVPAVLAVEEGLNEPRYVAVLGHTYRRGLGLSIEVLSPAGLGIADSELEPALVTIEVGPPRPRTKVGIKVTGLTMKEKLDIMRGRTTKKENELFTGSPEEAAQLMLGKLEEWL